MTQMNAGVVWSKFGDRESWDTNVMSTNEIDGECKAAVAVDPYEFVYKKGEF